MRLLEIALSVLEIIKEKQFEISDQDLVRKVQEEVPEFSELIWAEMVVENKHLIYLEDVCNALEINLLEVLKHSEKVMDGGLPIILTCEKCKWKKLSVFSNETLQVLQKNNINPHFYKCEICRGDN